MSTYKYFVWNLYKILVFKLLYLTSAITRTPITYNQRDSAETFSFDMFQLRKVNDV